MYMKFPVFLVALFLVFALPSPGRSGVFDWFSSKSPEDVITAALQRAMNENKQNLFKAFHPVGTATRVEVHEVKIYWRNNRPSKNLNDMLGYDVRFTLYWRGPLTSDGFTKVVMRFDNESKRWVQSQILATNGVTNEQAGEAAADFLKGLLEGQ